jgi:imidazole glycerol-phosphate synthase subunit HisH
MIIIVDYKAGNVTSVQRALNHLGLDSRLTGDPEEVSRAPIIIFPGVGHAASVMAVLRERGLDQALQSAFRKGTPILGICLGAQIVLSHSEEGDTPTLDLIEGECLQLRLANPALKIPHMGWDSISILRPHPIFEGVQPADEFYFVHSFYPQPARAEDVLAEGEYEIRFPAVIGRDNLVAAQFHPEKSGLAGLRMLKNFTTWAGLKLNS